ncbi:MAG: CDP-alcohol phosphatidyltransferase family protein [Oscillospiraceae bacterium]|nr:CDP-alcohol phosphatidyltransferase family protein [Oscillospiraceae bacterium]
MKHLPNIITSTRFVFAILLVFSVPLSMRFWLFYGLAATTDLIDGPIARKLKVNNNFGPTLDTSADIFFLICIMVCVFPILSITVQSYVLIGTVFLLKAISLLYAYIKFKTIVSYHTYLIKGLALVIFTFPFWILFLDENLLVLILAILQSGAYIEELLITRISDKPDANTKSIYHLRIQQEC